MNVIIDMTNLRFLAAHPDACALSSLAYVEFSHLAIRIEPTWFVCDEMTEAELRKLYFNTTGQWTLLGSEALTNVVIDLAERVPVRDINVNEVHACAQQIKPTEKGRFRYVKGMSNPMKVDELFETEFARVERNSEEAVIAKTGGAARPVRACVPLPGAVTTSTPSDRTQRPCAAPRQGSSKEIIHSVATEHWHKNGSPKDIPSILALRKQLMGILETDYNIKKTSSSNELGNWQKIILQNI